MGFALSNMQLISPAFDNRGWIPAEHTGEGPDTSPPMRFVDVPAEAASLAVFCHDPDAPLVLPGRYGFVHWVLYNLPADVRQLDVGSDLGTPGRNDFGRSGYGGPMPPEGHGPHHYVFWLLALDRDLDLPEGLDLSGLLEHVEPHVIAMNRLVGVYQRG